MAKIKVQKSFEEAQAAGLVTPAFQSVPGLTPSIGGPQPQPITPSSGISTPDVAEAAKKEITLEKKNLKPIIHRDPKTGKITILEIGGRTFLGLNKDEVQQVISGFQGRIQETPEGAIEGRELQLRESLAGQVGQPSFADGQVQVQEQSMISPLGQAMISAEQQTPGLFANADLSSAFFAGLGQGAIGAAALGGISLSSTAGAPAAPAAAAIGFVGGFIRGFTGKLKEDANQNIAAEFTSLQINSRNMRLLIIDAKTDPERSLAAFNAQLMAIDKAYTNIKWDSQDNLNKFLGIDAQVEMAKLENFYAPGGFREIYIARMQAVLLNPKTDVSDLLYASDFETERRSSENE